MDIFKTSVGSYGPGTSITGSGKTNSHRASCCFQFNPYRVALLRSGAAAMFSTLSCPRSTETFAALPWSFENKMIDVTGIDLHKFVQDAYDLSDFTTKPS